MDDAVGPKLLVLIMIITRAIMQVKSRDREVVHRFVVVVAVVVLLILSSIFYTVVVVGRL